MNRLLLTTILLLLSTQFSFAQYGDFVQFRDSTIMKGNIEVKMKTFGKNTITVNDSLKYFLQDVHAYQIDGDYFLRMYSGYGDAFAQRIEKGNIDLYTRVQRNYGGGMVPMGSVGSVSFGPTVGGSSQAQYFSKDGGPVLKANQRNLKLALFDNPISMDYLKKKDTATAIQVVGILGGIAITALSITSQKGSDEFNPTGPVIGLALVTGSAWIPYFQKKTFTRNAIQSYNHPEDF